MIYQKVQSLIDYAIQNELITNDDIYVVQNQLMNTLNLSDWTSPDKIIPCESIDDILNDLVDYACENGIIEDTTNNRDLFDTKLMGILTPMPREIKAEFLKRYAISPERATDWYYAISQKLNYVRAGRIEKDLKWTYDCEYGTLDITINLSKPEKDPRDIVNAKAVKTVSYPECQLCPENAGFAGHASHPARQNLRPIPITVNGDDWQLQYSPYGYYNEHCIAFNCKHTPMTIDNTVFAKLFDIVDFLPHYFIGSNADLPIVGGSILSHEHFQGGRYTFAMEKALIETEFYITAYPDVSAGIVKWPMSVIRVSSENRKQLEECCKHILKKWRGYTDEEAFIYAETDGTPHNTITPIARKKGNRYECDLVLRNNITTKELSLGVYHPNPSLHHIKRENIGLIEVMGLAVLPSRLAKEFASLKEIILKGGNPDSIPELSQHSEWAKEILAKHPDFSKSNADSIINEEVGKVFLEILNDAGVFKRTREGQKAFMRFIEKI